MRLLKILIVILLICFPFGELLRFDIGNNIRFKPLDLITGMIMIYWLILLITRQIQFPKNTWQYFLFPCVAFFSLIINSFWLSSSSLTVAGLYLVRWISYLSVFFVIAIMHQDFKKKLLTMLLVDGLIIVILGFAQFFFFSSLKPFYYLGWDDHMYRLFSVFLDPNYTGGFYVLYTLFVGGLLYTCSKEKKLTANQSILITPFVITNRNTRALLTAIISLTAIALFLTFSRSTILMFIVATSIFFLLIGRKKLILGLFGFIIVFTVLISSRFYIENVNLFRQASTTARLGNYQVSFRIISSNPILGVGFNAYRYAKEKYNIQMDWTKNPSHADAGVDNSFLFVLATTGIVGLVSYLYLWYSILEKAIFLHRKKKSIFALIVLSSMAGLFIHALFINSLFFPAIMVWMWIMIGLMEQT